MQHASETHKLLEGHAVCLMPFSYDVRRICLALGHLQITEFSRIIFSFQDVTGQVVLITGGGGGVGANLARNFAKLGSRVIIWDINQDGNFFSDLHFAIINTEIETVLVICR